MTYPAGYRGPPDTANGMVTGIRGYHVSNATPTDGQALVWNDAINEWKPEDQAAASVGGNPTAVVGSVAINGSASTFMRSDAAPAIGTLASITLSEIAAPAAPLSGAILYVDSTSHLLSYVDSQGNRAVIT